MLTIRQARPSDCDAMCDVYRAAILHHYSSTHGEDTAAEWASSVRKDVCDRWLASGIKMEKQLEYGESRPERRRVALARMGPKVDLDGVCDG